MMQINMTDREETERQRDRETERHRDRETDSEMVCMRERKRESERGER